MGLTHFDDNGHAVMVDVGGKPETNRTAIAKGSIKVNKKAYQAIMQGTNHKGDVLGTARIAGIMGAKRTAELIPMCHVLMLTHCSIDFKPDGQTNTIYCTCTVKTDGKTGVEMEALTGVNIALLTIYDMCKALDKQMTIQAIYLDYKEGGKSGIIKRQAEESDEASSKI